MNKSIISSSNSSLDLSGLKDDINNEVNNY